MRWGRWFLTAIFLGFTIMFIVNGCNFTKRSKVNYELGSMVLAKKYSDSATTEYIWAGILGLLTLVAIPKKKKLPEEKIPTINDLR